MSPDSNMKIPTDIACQKGSHVLEISQIETLKLDI